MNSEVHHGHWVFGRVHSQTATLVLTVALHIQHSIEVLNLGADSNSVS